MELDDHADQLNYCPHSKPKKFVIKKEFNLDYTKLESDLHTAIESDQRYWLQNDAKLRAVQQPGTYEDFRQIVLGAHLKPMEKADKISLGPTSNNRVIWNSVADGKSEDSKLTKLGTSDSMYLESMPTPQTIPDFSKHWKAIKTNAHKFAFLELLICKNNSEDVPFKNIVKNGLPLNELPEVFSVLLAALENEGSSQESLKIAQSCLTILEIISESSRFEFSKVFFTSEDLSNLDRIISKLENLFLCEDGEELYQLLSTLSKIKLQYTETPISK